MTKTPEYVETFPDGTTFERPWTPEELAQQKKDKKEFAAQQAAQEAAVVQKKASIQSAVDKLAKLGLNDDEISTVLGFDPNTAIGSL